MRKIIGIWKNDHGCGTTRDYAVKSGIIKLAGNKKSAAHPIEMGHEIAQGRDKSVRVHDFHGVGAAGVTIDELISREGQLPKPRLPT